MIYSTSTDELCRRIFWKTNWLVCRAAWPLLGESASRVFCFLWKIEDRNVKWMERQTSQSGVWLTRDFRNWTKFKSNGQLLTHRDWMQHYAISTSNIAYFSPSLSLSPIYLLREVVRSPEYFCSSYLASHIPCTISFYVSPISDPLCLRKSAGQVTRNAPSQIHFYDYISDRR